MARPVTITRRGSVYLIVLMTASMVTIIGVGAAYLRRHMLRASTLEADLLHARAGARAALEVGLSALYDDEEWSVSDVTTAIATGSTGPANFRVYLVDPQTGRPPADEDLKLYSTLVLIGEATSGEARARLAMDLSIPATGIHERALALNPARYWPLDDDGFQTVAVESVAGNNGVYTLAAVPASTPGPEGGDAPLFDGPFDSANAITSNAINTASGTITFWLNPGSGTGNRFILAKCGATSFNAGDLGFTIVGNAITVTHAGPLGNTVLTGTKPPANTWTFIAYRFTATHDELFVNGVSVASANAVLMLTHSSGDGVRIGGPTGATLFGVNQPIGGSVYGVGIFTEGLTNDEIASILTETKAKATATVIPQPQTTRWYTE